MAHCADNTFRIRVKCVPCVDDPPPTVCCCPDDTLPDAFCLTLGTADFAFTDLETLCNPADWAAAWSGAKISLIRVPGTERVCNVLVGTSSGYTGIWDGLHTFSIPCTYGAATMTYRFRLECIKLTTPEGEVPRFVLTALFQSYSSCAGQQCLPSLHRFCATTDPDPSDPFNCVDPLGNGSFAFDCPTATGSGVLAGEYPADGTVNGAANTIPFDLVPYAGSDCEAPDGTCCDTELGSHPNLCVVWAFGGGNTQVIEAVWTTFDTLTGWWWQVEYGGVYTAWLFQCPDTSGVSNSWVGYYFKWSGVFDSTPKIIAHGTGVCDPFSAVLSYEASPPEAATGGTLAITTGGTGCGSGLWTLYTHCSAIPPYNHICSTHTPAVCTDPSQTTGVTYASCADCQAAAMALGVAASCE